ncbi:MAG TPA: L,D-transpeptidase, partial [Mycobacteriales bacterium]|nr:L,D-transpeptidase [Mycobacteriales bacterium]
SMRSSRGVVVALATAIALTCGLGVVAAGERSQGEPASAGSTDTALPSPLAAEAFPPVVVEVAPPAAPVAAPAPAPKPAPAAKTAPAIRAAPREATPPRTPRLRSPRPARPPRAKTCTPAPAPPSTRATRARVIVSSIPVYASPGAAKPTRTMSNPREEDGLPLDFVVRARQGEWIKVQLPVRPNFTHGWVRVRDVELSGLPYRIVIELCAFRMTLYKDGQVVMRETVAVGQDRYPTPRGEFYIDYIYPFSMRSGYGPWLLSIAGFSDVLKNFAGGRGQIALHGTSAGSSLGRKASHGCIRLRPEASTALSKIIKPGTPVSIVA